MIDVRRLETSKEPPKINHISSNAAVHDLRPLSLSLSLTIIQGVKKIGTINPFACVYFYPQAPRKKPRNDQSPNFNACTPSVRGYSKEREKGYIKPRSRRRVRYAATARVCADQQRCTGFTLLFHLRLPVTGIFDRRGRTLVVVVSLILIALSAQISYSWPLCVALISVCCFPVHSMYGFRTPPTIPIPSARKPAGSFALITLTGGSRGLSALTCAASLAACSMASISSLQAAWSKGHTTIGCLSRMSRADDSLACTVC
jgi:hypothetical protein